MESSAINSIIANIKKEIELLINSPINDLTTLMSRRVEDKWSDAATVGYDSNPEIRKRYIRATYKDWRGHVYTRLGHIIVNPKDELNTNALNKVYAYWLDEGNIDVKKIRRINWNPVTSEKFMKDMMEEAELQRLYFLRKLRTDIGMNLPIHCLYGKRGCGKTFFLNHIYSKYHKILDDRKIIWIRVNLVEDYPEPTDNPGEWLMQWILSQLTKIVIRYYDPESAHYDIKKPKKPELHLYDVVYKYIMECHKNDQPLAHKHQTYWARVVSTLKRKQDELTTDPPEIYTYLGSFVLEQTIKAGYSVVVVLDGLDLLEIIPTEINKFERISGQVEQIIRSAGPRGYTLLLVSRSFNRDIRGSKVYSIGGIINNTLKDVPLKKIIEKRIEYLIEETKLLLDRKEYPFEASTGTDYIAHLINFSDYLENRLKAIDDSNYFETLEKYFSTNKRAQLQVIQMAYMEYLEKVQERLYLLTEFLCKGGSVFPPRPYDYCYKKRDNKVIREIGKHGKKFDHHLLPTISLFPYTQWYDDLPNEEVPHIAGAILGIRVMQVIYAHQQYRNKTRVTNNIPLLTSGEIAELLSLLFSYNKETILNLIEEYAEYEFLSIRGDDGMSTPDNRTRYIVHVLPKLEHVLNLTLFDIAYLNMSSLRIPLKKEVLTCDQPYFRARSFTTHGRPQDIATYVASKITNSIGIYRLIGKINEMQKDLLSTALPNLDAEQKIIVENVNNCFPNGFFGFVEQMRHSLIDSLHKAILPSLSERDTGDVLTTVYQHIQDYRKRWQNC